MKIIYILGLDGSGKTTHAKRFVSEYKDNKVKYLYLQYFPFLLRPIKYFANKILLKGADEYNDYSSYSKKKKDISSKINILTRLYSLIWYFDYGLQILPKILFYKYLRSYEILIIDRYYLDTITHIAFLLNFNKDKILKEAKILEKIFPKADHYIFLDVLPEIAYQRKNDIQSKEYLIERKTYYNMIENEYSFIKINSNIELFEVYTNFAKSLTEVIN